MEKITSKNKCRSAASASLLDPVVFPGLLDKGKGLKETWQKFRKLRKYVNKRKKDEWGSCCWFLKVLEDSARCY